MDTAPDGAHAIEMLAANRYNLVITDVNMPRTNGLELLRAIKNHHPDVVVLVITGYGTIENAVEAVKMGAFEYLTKPIIDDEIRVTIQKALKQQTLLSENHLLKQQLGMRYGLDNIVGHDYKMLKIFDLVEAVADSRTTVLMTGESGTGKSLIARAIHHRSPRAGKAFVEVSLRVDSGDAAGVGAVRACEGVVLRGRRMTSRGGFWRRMGGRFFSMRSIRRRRRFR